jgi:hypothetical protein
VIFVGRPASKAKPVVRVLILDEALLKNKRKGLEDHRVDADAFIDPYEALRHLSKRHALQHNTLLDVLTPRMSGFEFPRQT